jgi:predicted small metal-binding protein
MAYTLACGDVMPGCDAKFSADSEEELLAQAAPHAAEVHGITELSPEVLEAVKGAIRQG